ncbi:patellin-4 [Cucurbita pepo subsp. pepo]|uniref:patellin-4 n=1 Tax=Cucurbita pepo subsp. pepo TaxID=3664 RepID=UPI000C9D9672|nr:patellin-4 [Cucurbita pepo subsp. pepo]XP_023520387.1 patellin-4 [Cucurbita pepo subsp. pepo]XP_023520388.1 patellin-4 [Cucurbita pepo subsp. pepo]XP_023520389.1 patellin-4 [Cucurbita pepo subsp. pepo]
MTVEVVKLEGASMAAVEVPDEPKKVVIEEEKEEKSAVKTVEDEALKPSAIDKSSSYKEESNHLSDLKEFEKKALAELKSKLEEAILGNNLFKEDEPIKKEKETEQPIKETEQSIEETEQSIEETEQKPEEKNNEEQTQKINEEIMEVSLWGVPLLPSKGTEATDVILLKFLRAREFKVNEAYEMLQKTLSWRKKSNIDSILKEEFPSDLESAALMNGVDREGHPVCYNVFGVFETEDLYQKTFGTEEKTEQFLRWRFQVMEKGIQKLDLKPGGVSSLLQINDLKNSPGPVKKELRIATKKAVAILQDNYPEFVAKNIFINVPFWYYALNALLSPFLTQRTKSKIVVARPAKVTETLLKYIPAEEIPVQYGGFKRENDGAFTPEDSGVSELNLKAGSTASIEIPAGQGESQVIWDLTVVGWEVNYKEEFVPSDEGSYTIIVQKGKKMSGSEEPVRNSFRNSEAGKIVLTVENVSNKKKRVLYRFKTKNIE